LVPNKPRNYSDESGAGGGEIDLAGAFSQGGLDASLNEDDLKRDHVKDAHSQRGLLHQST
jgi:hypothetical protein